MRLELRDVTQHVPAPYSWSTGSQRKREASVRDSSGQGKASETLRTGFVHAAYHCVAHST